MKKTIWKKFFGVKKRKRKPKIKKGIAVKAVPKRYKVCPERWEPPFSTNKEPLLNINTRNLAALKEVKGFDLGKITVTIGVMLRLETDHNFNSFINDSLKHFENLDWGSVSEREGVTNDRNVLTRTGVVCGSYTDLYSGVQIRIVTDLKQGVTRVSMFDEY